MTADEARNAPTAQGKIFAARADFAFRPAHKGARRVEVRTGQRFWITNTVLGQAIDGLVMVNREGKGSISSGYAFAPDQFAQLFQAA
jgi:hypothetical protein